jgi:jasmonate O-methyltransferase
MNFTQLDGAIASLIHFLRTDYLRTGLQAPEELKRNQIPAYDIDENVRIERRPLVIGAYARQFRKDFTLFLEMRAKELASGGRMVVSLAGRRSEELASKFTNAWESVAQILSEMVSKVSFFTLTLTYSPI